MNIKRLMKDADKVMLVVSLADLKEFAIELINNSSIRKERMLSRKEAAQVLNIDLSTLYKWTRTGKIRSFNTGKKVYYRLSDVDDLTQINTTDNKLAE